MAEATADGHYYHRKLPHYRNPGATYHVRMCIDDSYGFLKSDREFQIIQDSIFFTHKRWCIVHAYVIMPNHCHMALQPLPKADDLESSADYRNYYKIESILGSIKKYTAREINKIRGRSGPLWQDECFDRTVRNDRDFDDLIEYIHGNPVRWKLVERPEEYRWSSASTIYSGSEKYKDWFL